MTFQEAWCSKGVSSFSGLTLEEKLVFERLHKLAAAETKAAKPAPMIRALPA